MNDNSKAETIARQVLRSFFGDPLGFKDMQSSSERRACVQEVAKLLEADDVHHLKQA